MSYPHERKYPRYEFAKLPWVFGLQFAEPASTEHPIRVEAKNIGNGGCKFASNKKIPLFQEIQVSLFDKKTGTLVTRLTGKVIRLEEVDTGLTEKLFGIALEFVESPAFQEKLAAIQPLKG